MGDGLPCFLTCNEFYEKVVEHEAAQKREEREKEARKRARGVMAEAIAKWKKDKTEWKARNEERQVRSRQAVEKWKAEKAVALAAKKRFNKLRPVQEKLEAPVLRPKPYKTAVEEDLGSEEEVDEDEFEDDED